MTDWCNFRHMFTVVKLFVAYKHGFRPTIIVIYGHEFQRNADSQTNRAASHRSGYVGLYLRLIRQSNFHLTKTAIRESLMAKNI